MHRQAETAARYPKDSEKRKAGREELRCVTAAQLRDSEKQGGVLLVRCWGLGWKSEQVRLVFIPL